MGRDPKDEGRSVKHDNTLASSDAGKLAAAIQESVEKLEGRMVSEVSLVEDASVPGRLKIIVTADFGRDMGSTYEQ